MPNSPTLANFLPYLTFLNPIPNHAPYSSPSKSCFLGHSVVQRFYHFCLSKGQKKNEPPLANCWPFLYPTTRPIHQDQKYNIFPLSIWEIYIPICFSKLITNVIPSVSQFSPKQKCTKMNPRLAPHLPCLLPLHDQEYTFSFTSLMPANIFSLLIIQKKKEKEKKECSNVSS